MMGFWTSTREEPGIREPVEEEPYCDDEDVSGQYGEGDSIEQQMGTRYRVSPERYPVRLVTQSSQCKILHL